MMRRFLTVTLLAAMLCALSAVPALGQTYPSKKVFIVVPYPAGGGVDTLARALGRSLQKLWGQPVVVENLPGASSIIGASKVARARPDGYTLLCTLGDTVVANRFLYKHLPYNPDKGLAPITMIAQAGQFVIANPSFPPNNLHELVALARRHPNRQIAYGSYGKGTPPNLLFAMLGKITGVQFLQVPYQGTTGILSAVMRGDVKVAAVGGPTKASPLVKAGRLKALAIGGPHRSSVVPTVPTIAESGYPSIKAVAFWGLFATGGTPRAVVDRINRDVTGILKRPAFDKRNIIERGFDLVADTPAQFAAAIRANVKVTAKMMKAAGIKPK